MTRRIDCFEQSGHFYDVLTKILRSLLVFVVLLGTAGQAMAYATPMAPATPMTAAPVARQSAAMDCAGMAVAAPDNGQQPCETMLFDCLAKPGCAGVSLLPVPTGHARAAPVSHNRIYYPSRVASIAGLTVEPEVFPPIA